MNKFVADNLTNPSLLVIFSFFAIFFILFLSIAAFGYERKIGLVFIVIAFILIIPINLYFSVTKNLKNPYNISEYYNVQMKNEDNYIELIFKEKNNIKVDYELVIATEVKFKIESNDNELIISNTSNNNKKRITKEKMQEYLGKIKNKKIIDKKI